MRIYTKVKMLRIKSPPHHLKQPNIIQHSGQSQTNYLEIPSHVTKHCVICFFQNNSSIFDSPEIKVSYYSLPKNWNSLPVELKRVTSLTVFKIETKKKY